MNFDSIVRLIFYPFLIIFIGLFIFITYKTVQSYKKRNALENQVVILADEIDGSSADFISDMKLASSSIGNNYSITFNLSLDSNFDKNKEYTIFSRGSLDRPELKLSLQKHSESSSNSLRFLFKINNLDENNNAVHTPELSPDSTSDSDNAPDSTSDSTSDSDTVPDSTQQTSAFKNTKKKLLKTQCNTVDSNCVYSESFFDAINHNNTDNFLSTNPLVERFNEKTDEVNEMLNTINVSLENNEVKSKIKALGDKLYDITESSSELSTTDNSTNLATEVNNNNNNNNTENKQDAQNSCNGLAEVHEYDYCDLINNNLDTRFHIGLTIYNNIIDIYKNGDLISSCVLKGEPNPSMMPFEFLGNGGFKGSIGQFNYYNTTLNTEQMKTIYQHDINKNLPRNMLSLNTN